MARSTSRFDYTKFDKTSSTKLEDAKQAYKSVEALIEGVLPVGSREKSLVLTKLEESFMWVGKAIRNEQIERERLHGAEGS
jgi:hypothetical protein